MLTMLQIRSPSDDDRYDAVSRGFTVAFAALQVCRSGALLNSQCRWSVLAANVCTVPDRSYRGCATRCVRQRAVVLRTHAERPIRSPCTLATQASNQAQTRESITVQKCLLCARVDLAACARMYTLTDHSRHSVPHRSSVNVSAPGDRVGREQQA